MMLQVKIFSMILAWTVTWLGFGNVELKTITDIADHANVNDQAPTPPKVDCYQFTNWDGSADNVTSDLVIRAVYEQYKYNLSIDSEPEMLHGTIKAEAPYAFDESGMILNIPCGTAVSVTAVPDEGYKLSEWYQNGVKLNTTATTIDIVLDESTVVDGNIAIRATFAEDSGTGLEELTGDGLQVTGKVLRDGQLLIERDVNIYTITGQQIK